MADIYTSTVVIKWWMNSVDTTDYLHVCSSANEMHVFFIFVRDNAKAFHECR